jgi:hypothetical protein
MIFPVSEFRAWVRINELPELVVLSSRGQDRHLFIPAGADQSKAVAVLAARLRDLMDIWTRMIRILHRPFGCETAIGGWRARRGSRSVQIVLHWHPLHGFIFEADKDRNNPGWGLYYLIRHGIDFVAERIL